VRFSARVYPEKGYLEGVGYEITEEKSALKDLRKSEQRFKEMADLLPTIVCEIGMDLRVTYVNSLAFEKTGFTQSDFEAGINAMDLLNPGDRNKAVKRIEQTLKGEKLESVEYGIYKKDGSLFPVLLNSAPIYKDGQITGIRFSMADMAEQKELQQRLHRAQKMEAMGLMAGGVAHDLNNILSGIVSYPELLLMDLPEDSPLRNPIKTIQESGMRAADVVEDLMTIAKGAASSKEALDLNNTVKEYMDSAEHKNLESTHSFVTFKTQLDSDLLNVNASRTHIKKALMNLAVNASEAIEGVGTVTISTVNQYLDEPLKGYEDVRTGEYAVLIVSDDGSGILPQDLERIFEPFYTKRVMGRVGTGLGLAVVWNSMQDHNGYINVKSSEKGTIFELYFPVTREEVAGAEAEVPLEDYLGHGEKILVVDDEERQRKIASGILTRLGYNAETVSSGEEAIEYVKENPVDLIVLDMVMPKGINGRKTYEEIIKIRPGQKAIIASGFAKTKEVDMAQELGAGKYIKKPYTLAKVGVAVKEELEK
ncbi:MAG: response regulator, partial [Desulfobacteraceae bacterium]|nr:response regulator [Desulfobacteraceae bacterium]